MTPEQARELMELSRGWHTKRDAEEYFRNQGTADDVAAAQAEQRALEARIAELLS
jgi:hypothetical protein